jgi:hypothetical protein
VSREDDPIIIGSIDTVQIGLKSLGHPIPDNVDYPISLKKYFLRDIESTTLQDARERTTFPFFIKPKFHKLFT